MQNLMTYWRGLRTTWIPWLRRQLLVKNYHAEIITHDNYVLNVKTGIVEHNPKKAKRRRKGIFRLRYFVYGLEQGAQLSAAQKATKQEWDDYDVHPSSIPGGKADYIAVICSRYVWPFGKVKFTPVVGCYRMLRQNENKSRFYTAEEFDLAALLEARSGLGSGVVELSRSAVHKDHRDGPTMKQLWRGIACYLATYQPMTLFGTASFWEQDVQQIAPHLAYLATQHSAPDDATMVALPRCRIEVPDVTQPLSRAQIKQALPPLIRGYLGLGGLFSQGAVIDREMGTIDVGVMLFLERISPKALQHFDYQGRLSRLIANETRK